jgi:hypothetical protein
MNIVRHKFCTKHKYDALKIVFLNKLFVFLKIVGRITIYNSIKNNIITANFAYYMFVQLKLRYEYSMTLILYKI